MNKVLRCEDVNPDDVISLGVAEIEAVDESITEIIEGHEIVDIYEDTPSTKNITVEIFIEKIEGSTYVYAGDAEGNLYEHLNGYVGLWIKRDSFKQ